MIRGNCAYCGGEVTTKQQAAFRVTGVELEREQGGANRIFAKEREPNWIAHRHCAEAAERTRDGEQLRLA